MDKSPNGSQDGPQDDKGPEDKGTARAPRDGKKGASGRAKRTGRAPREAGGKTNGGAKGTARAPRNGDDDKPRRDDAGLGSTPDAGAARTSPALLGSQQPGSVLFGEYTVVETFRPHESARAGIYRCTHPELGEIVLKVAPTLYAPAQATWRRVTELDHPGVIRTHRVFQRDGLYVDVQEYCSAGSLDARLPGAEASPDARHAVWMMEDVAPQTLSALLYLHEREIIHRDIKPANIYIRKTDGGERYVLADLDISARLDASVTSRVTDRFDMTYAYAAPEMLPKYIGSSFDMAGSRVSRASDFYCLGISLIELTCGVTGLGAADFVEAQDFYAYGGRVQVPDGLPERLRLLLAGLTVPHPRYRWSTEAAARWLAGENTADDVRNATSPVQFPAVSGTLQPLKVAGEEVWDLPQLSRALLEHPQELVRDLMTGHGTIDWVFRWDTAIANRMGSAIEQLRDDPELAVFAAAICCDPDLRLRMGEGLEARTPAEWARNADELIERGAPETAVAGREALSRLEQWLRLRGAAEPELADRIAEVRRRKGPLTLKCSEVAWLVDQERPYVIHPGEGEARLPQDVARLTYGRNEDWQNGPPDFYTASRKLWRKGYLAAWLRARGLEKLAGQCADLASAQTPPEESAAHLESSRDTVPANDAPSGDETARPCIEARFETVLRLLDPELPRVSLSIDVAALVGTLRAPFGSVRVVKVPWDTEGTGIPHGTLVFDDALPGLQVVDPEVAAREGVARVRLDSRNDVPVARTHKARLRFDGAYSAAPKLPLEIAYKVDYPLMRTLLQVAVGALALAFLLGIARLATGFLDAPEAVTRADWGWTPDFKSTGEYTDWVTSPMREGLWATIQAGVYPRWPFVAGAAVLVAVVVLAWVLWRVVLRHRSEA